ncbi:MAG: hypothetical protein GYB68_12585 [Chloroflexi bacterium]|nr:hypothetical protein [Chloroflexota bacterium]
MTKQQPPDDQPQKPSETALPSEDPLYLGRTAGQRGAEILAGIRALVLNSPTARTLSKPRGRVIAQMMMTLLPHNTAGLNFLGVRTSSMAELVKVAIQDMAGPTTIVEVAAGFSPRGLELAFELPEVQVIEVDLPDVVQDKRRRLRALDLPPNITWKEADLGQVTLASLLEGQQVSAIVAEGLLPYFEPDDHVRIGKGFFDNLLPGGVFVADYLWVEGFEQAKDGARFFSRQAGQIKGMVESEERPKEILAKAGFQSVDVYRPSELAERFDLPRPVLDFELIVAAHKPVKAG